MKRYIKADVVALEDELVKDKIALARTTDRTRTLLKLSQDPSDYVRLAVAKNPNTPVDILRKLVADSFSFEVSTAALHNNTVTVDILNQWIYTQPIVVARIAKDKKTPSSVLHAIVTKYQEHCGSNGILGGAVTDAKNQLIAGGEI